MSEIDELKAWEGRSERRTDLLAPSRARGMLALLDRDPAGLSEDDVLPPGWHWLYFNPTARRSELGEDGHREGGGLIPPMPLPRRMWAGGRIRFPGELRLGQGAELRSTLASVTEKEGRSGRLLFVTVRHEVSSGGAGPAVVEEQDLVYREGGTPEGGFRGGPDAPAEAAWRESFSTDPVTLFRFSALTFNGHRIHYDHPYATEVEGYPDLVVHGPLLALLLLDAGGRRLGVRPGRFSYRAVSPLFCGEGFSLCGAREDADDPTRLWAAHPERGVAMKAELEAAG